MNPIATNLARLRDDIAAAARSVHRNPADIKLIAISKTHSIASIDAALAAGQRAFGENTVQEALGKIAHFGHHDPTRGVIPTDEIVPEWHFIGHLQSNKARSIPGNFAWLHSLDNLKLAQRLNRFAEDQHVALSTLLEVNITQDSRKHGIEPSAVASLLDQFLAQEFSAIMLRGLMTIGPYPATESEIRRTYAALRHLLDECKQRFDLPTFDQLSMGMSGDYLEAVKEGATMLRIGTAIFGDRDYGTTN
jgi:pyridoxal phosphate enzyme (YggS family)